MKEKSYMSSFDILEFIKIAVLAGECEQAATNLGKVVDERMECLEYDQKKTVKRRWTNSEVRLYTSDQMRVEDKNPQRENVTISYDDWCLLGAQNRIPCRPGRSERRPV